MTINPALFSSATDEWATPQDLFDLLAREFAFDLDVCATPGNAKSEYFFTKADDGLRQTWTSRAAWMNPPYSAVAAWMEKAASEAAKGATVVCLVPARTDTKWFQAAFEKASEVRFLKGRLKFGESKNSAPFPSAVVVFEPPRTFVKSVTCWNWRKTQ